MNETQIDAGDAARKILTAITELQEGAQDRLDSLSKEQEEAEALEDEEESEAAMPDEDEMTDLQEIIDQLETVKITLIEKIIPLLSK